MKLTDENGGEWVEVRLHEIVDRLTIGCQTNVLVIRKIEPPKAKPMPDIEIRKLEERVYVLEKVSDELRDAFCKISRQITPSHDKA